MDDNRITYFAETDARNTRLKFGIKANDRTRHVYVIGKTGMGKSTMLENMAVQDIQNGSGMCFIDPHGKTADLLLEYVPKNRIRDVIYIAPFDVEHPISFNVLESVDRDKRHLVSSGLMSTFKKIWEDAWSARMEYILTNTLLALLEYPGSTLLGVNRMLSDKEYRKDVVSHIQDPSVKAFWVKEFANYTERQAAEAVPAIQNKVGQFTANPLIRNMIGQSTSSFDFRKAMDERKIIIINLSKGRIGDENMKLLGGLLVTKIYLAAMSRADVPDRVMKMLPNFYLFVDEFQNFANASFADILSEARKYKLNLTIAHQYIEQMDELVRPAVFGNVGTMIAFRVGANDAEELEKEFAPVFVLEDLVNLGFAQIYLKLMIDGLSSTPFSATTLPPIAHPDTSYVKEIIDSSREQYSKPRAEVEQMVVDFHNPIAASKATTKSASVSSSSASVPAPVSGSQPVKTAPKPANPFISKPSVRSAAKPEPSAALPQSVVAPKPVAPTPPAPEPSEPVSKPVPPPAAVQESAPVPAPRPQPPRAPRPVIEKAPAQPKPKPAPVARPVSSPKPIPKPAPIAPTRTEQKPPIVQAAVPIEPARPVSLSALAAKPASEKLDPKVPTKENVNSLKNALAAALAKGKPETKPEVKTQPVVAPAPRPAQPSAPAPKHAPLPQPAPAPIPTPNPQEVPEAVLKDILKDE